MQATNKDKNVIGRDVKNTLKNVITRLSSKFKGEFSVKYNVKFGAPNKKKNQFSADALITFKKEIWIIKATNSYRSDRIKGNEFDFEHIKKLLGENKKVLAYFVVPDSILEKEMQSITALDTKISNERIVTYFDGALLMSELENLIQMKCTALINQGRKANILGKLSEDSIIAAFQNKNNILRWNDPQNRSISYNYRLFFLIMTGFGINRNLKIKKITNLKTGSSDNEQYLDKDLKIVKSKNKNKGMPKTDVLITLLLENNQEKTLKITVKRPNSIKSKVITVQQISMENLIQNLKFSLSADSYFYKDEEFKKLESSLLDLQRAGGPTKMLPSYKDYLDKYIHYLNDWLIGFFIFGKNNSLFNDKQIANLAVIFDPSNGLPFVYNEEEMKQHLSKMEKSFKKSPFTWTYHRGTKGREIQVKSPLFFN